MSTRSYIGELYKDGSILFVYCHFDGYPDHHLPILNKYYDTHEKVQELLALGRISVLAPRVEPNPDENHSFDHPVRDVVIAYHRDRGEELETYTARSRKEFEEYVNKNVDFGYLFEESTGKWIFYNPYV
jgi:hypothetical protein